LYAFLTRARVSSAANYQTETCFICGREYGRSSLGIHQKQCAKLWEATEAKKPKAERRPLPARPKAVTRQDVVAANILNGGDGVTLSAKDAVHAKKQVAADHFNETALVRCEFCSRTFLPDRLAIHHRSCRSGSSSKSAQDSKRKTVDTGRADGRVAVLEKEKVDRYRSPTLAAKDPGAVAGAAADDRVQCPKCSRRFAPDAAQRHIPTCCAKPVKRRPSDEQPKIATPNRSTPRSVRLSVEASRGDDTLLNPFSQENYYYSETPAPAPSASTLALIDKIEMRVSTLSSELDDVKALLRGLRESLVQ